MSRIAGDQWIRDEALRALAGAGCPVCRRGEAADERFAFRFSTELYTHPHILDQVSAARGFCPTHARRLMRRREARWVLRYVHAAVVGFAIRRLEGGRDAAPAICYACRNRAENEAALTRIVLAALGDADVTTAYRASGGFCYEHLARALWLASPAQAAVIAEVFGDPMSQPGALDRWLHLVAGPDADASPRYWLAQRLPRHDPGGPCEATQPTLQRLQGRLVLEACPACLAGGLTEQRYLRWLADQHRGGGPARLAEVPWLCPRHLRDLALGDPDTAGWVANQARAALAYRVAQLRERLADLPAAGLRGRALAVARELGATARSGASRWWDAVAQAAGRVVQSRRAAFIEALRPFAQPPYCGACDARETAERREGALVVGALADPVTVRRYEAAHGLCLRHVEALAASDRALPRRVVLARLRVLLWELEEAGRKTSWQYRYEPLTAEGSAWYRAPALLDGQAFLGGPPCDLSASCAQSRSNSEG